MKALVIGVALLLGGAGFESDAKVYRAWRAHEETYRRGERGAEFLVDLADLNACHPLGDMRAYPLYRAALASAAPGTLQTRAAEGLIRVLARRGRFAEAVGVAGRAGGPLFAGPSAGLLSPLDICRVATGRTVEALERLRATLRDAPPVTRAEALRRVEAALVIGEIHLAAARFAEAEHAFRAGAAAATAWAALPAGAPTLDSPEVLVSELRDGQAAALRALGREDEADAVDPSPAVRVFPPVPAGPRPPRDLTSAAACGARTVWFANRGAVRQARHYARLWARLAPRDPGHQADLGRALAQIAKRWTVLPLSDGANPEAADTGDALACWTLVRRLWLDRQAGRASSGDPLYPLPHEVANAAIELALAHRARGERTAAIAVLEDARAITREHAADVGPLLPMTLADEYGMDGAFDAAARVAVGLRQYEVDHARGQFPKSPRYPPEPERAYPRFWIDATYRRFGGGAPSSVEMDLDL